MVLRNIHDVPAKQHLIVEGIRQAPDPKFRKSLAGMTSPYGDGHAPGDLPITESQADRALALPFFNRITEEQIDEVSTTLCDLVSLCG